MSRFIRWEMCGLFIAKDSDTILHLKKIMNHLIPEIQSKGDYCNFGGD